MKILHKLTGTILTWVLENKYILLVLNILLPVAIYFEAGPVSAAATYFGFFLLISIAKSLHRDEQMKEEMHKAMEPHLESILNKIKKSGETTEFDTEKYSGSITAIKAEDLPDEIKEMMESHEKEEANKEEPTKH